MGVYFETNFAIPNVIYNHPVLAADGLLFTRDIPAAYIEIRIGLDGYRAKVEEWCGCRDQRPKRSVSDE
jgi:hypothetical protein